MKRQPRAIAPYHQSEQQIENSVCHWLDYKGIKYWITKVKGEPHFKKNGEFFMKKTPNRGFPDILCCIKGKMIGLEIKTVIGRQSEYQKEQQRKILAAGGIYWIIRNIQELEIYMQEEGFV
jgi:hypothetical protein